MHEKLDRGTNDKDTMRNFFQDVFDIKDDFNIKLNNLPDKDLQEIN